MTHILFRQPLALRYQQLLIKDFPNIRFTFFEDIEDQKVTDDLWSDVEVLFGAEFLVSELAKAPMLRWIHSPQCNLDRICLDEVFATGNVVVTCPQEQNVRQIGEYVMATVFAFSKQLFSFKDIGRDDPHQMWKGDLRDKTWILGDKTFLQVGLDNIGTEVTRCAHCLGMKVQGVHHRRSFHPHCETVVAETDLHSILPNADVVCISLPCSKRYYHWFGEDEFKLMKDDSILVVVHCGRVVDMKALEKAAVAGKFRGVIMDAYEKKAPPKSSPLWNLSSVLLTPQLSGYPHVSPDGPFQSFCHNIHCYLTEAYDDLKDIVDEKVYSS